MLDVQPWAEIRRMKEVEGLSIHGIVRRTGHDRNTVRRALRREGLPRYRRPPRPSKLDPVKDEIHRLLQSDPRIPGERIRELIEELGYDGGKTILDEHQRVLGRAWTQRGRPPEGYLTKQLAQRELDAILADAQRGQLIAPVRPAGGVSFEEAAQEWLGYVEHDRKRRPSTIRDYRIVVANVLVPAFGEAPLEAITSAHVDTLRTRLVAEGRLSARTINKYVALLHGILKRAQRVYGLSANAAAGVERQPLRHSGDFDVLSVEEVEALIRAAASPQDAALYATAAYAGLRLGELRALRWCDVDFDKRLIHVRRSYVQRGEGTPKSGRVRSVPMIDQVARVLDELSRRNPFTRDEDLVFCNDLGKHFEDSALRRRFYAARKLAGLKPIRFHDLRHTFGTLAVQVFPLSDVKAYMGHADIATTMIYVHHVPQVKAAERLSRALAGDRSAEALSAEAP